MQEAMRFYTSLFEGSSIGQAHYQENGQVLHAVFTQGTNLQLY